MVTEREKEYHHQYYLANKAMFSAKGKQWRESHKDLVKEYNKKYREAHKEKAARYAKEYRESHREGINQRVSKWREQNIDERRKYQRDFMNSHLECYRAKNNIRKRTRAAIRRGELSKEPCAICGELKVEAHHTDYNKPLNVTWLCKKHHAEWHRLNKAVELDGYRLTKKVL